MLHDESRPRGAAHETPAKKSATHLTTPADVLADLDGLASHLNGRFVVQVVVDSERGLRRTFVYRNCAAAERAVERARERGQTSHVTLVQMLPVGVVTGLGVAR